MFTWCEERIGSNVFLLAVVVCGCGAAFYRPWLALLCWSGDAGLAFTTGGGGGSLAVLRPHSVFCNPACVEEGLHLGSLASRFPLFPVMFLNGPFE